MLLIRCRVRVNILGVILLHNGYFFKKIYWDNIFFYFLKLIFPLSHQNKKIIITELLYNIKNLINLFLLYLMTEK